MSQLLSLLQELWNRMDGKKTYAAVALGMALAANQAIATVYHVTLLDAQWVQLVQVFAEALGIVGVAHKYEKSQSVMLDIAEALESLHQIAIEREERDAAIEAQITQMMDKGEPVSAGEAAPAVQPAA